MRPSSRCGVLNVATGAWVTVTYTFNSATHTCRMTVIWPTGGDCMRHMCGGPASYIHIYSYCSSVQTLGKHGAASTMYIHSQKNQTAADSRSNKIHTSLPSQARATESSSCNTRKCRSILPVFKSRSSSNRPARLSQLYILIHIKLALINNYILYAAQMRITRQ